MKNAESYEIWEVLQISPTNSKKEIRKAYAKLIKECHPEEEPEKFRHLHTAYQHALKRTEQTIAEKKTISYKEEETQYIKTIKTSKKPSMDEAIATIHSTCKITGKLLKWEKAFETWLDNLKRIAQEYNYKKLFVIRPFCIPEQITYIREFYTEPQELKVLIEKLASNPMIEQFCLKEETKQYLFTIQKEVLFPKTLIEIFYGYYAKKDCNDINKEEKNLLHYFMKVLTLYRRLPEYHCQVSYEYKNAVPEMINERNLEFWEYMFAYGFGCRHAWEEDTLTLTQYMEELYQPSMEWRKEFTKFYEKRPLQYEFDLSDKTQIKIEFHLYYVLYYRNGKMVNRGIPFSQLVKEANAGLTIEQFFFLLGMTDITEEERYRAKYTVLKYLKKLPLYQPTLETIAECLTNDCTPQVLPEHERKRIYLTMYKENERFCFRIQATYRKFEVHYYAKEGWIPMPLFEGEAKAYKALSIEARPAYLKNKLNQFQQPAPILDCEISLEGMTEKQKVVKILEVFRVFGKKQRKRFHKGDTPYIPGFPWGKEDLFEAVYVFFREIGGYLTNFYVIFHIGKEKRAPFYKIFTINMNIFGYPLNLKSEEIATSYLQRCYETENRIKENRFLTVGKIGWGEDSVPYPITIGESGKFYSFDEELGLIQADSFEHFLSLLFDFQDITSIRIYEGYISVSKLDHKLEYCYGYEGYQGYLNRKTPGVIEALSSFF